VGRFDEEVTAVRSALIVVDMVSDFIDGALANPAAGQIISSIASLAEPARDSRDWVVVYTNDAHLPDDFELKVFPPHAMAGTDGAAVVTQLAPRAGDVVVGKRFYSGFTQTNLADELESLGVRRLVLVGQHTDCCVRHTCYDAFCRGYELVVCADGTTVYEPGADEPVATRQERALEYLQTFYGARVAASEAVF
jgi:nicotinamidase-related amidase